MEVQTKNMVKEACRSECMYCTGTGSYRCSLCGKKIRCQGFEIQGKNKDLGSSFHYERICPECMEKISTVIYSRCVADSPTMRGCLG